MTRSIQGPNAGLVIPNQDVKLIAHAACAKGAVVTLSEAVQTVNSVVVPQLYQTAQATDGDEVSTSDNTGIAAVAIEAVADGAEGLFRIRGMVEADHDTDVAIGASLTVKAGASLDLTACVAGTKCVAQAVEARTGAGLAMVMFDGINGFGFGI
jgi:hypothetical protein